MAFVQGGLAQTHGAVSPEVENCSADIPAVQNNFGGEHVPLRIVKQPVSPFQLVSSREAFRRWRRSRLI